MEKLEVLNILKRGLMLYKSNFGMFIKASLIYFTILFCSSVITLVYGLQQSNVMMYVEMLFTLITIYFTFRLTITIYIMARDLIKSQETSLKSTYGEAKQYFWRYIGNTILITFPMMIPLSFIQHIQRNPLPLLYKLPQLAVVGVLSGIIASYFYFAPISVALEPDLPKRIRYSIKLVRGNLFQVFLALCISSFIFSLPSYLFKFIEIGLIQPAYFVFIKSTLTNVIYTLSMPFTECVAVILFYELRRIKNSKNVQEQSAI